MLNEVMYKFAELLEKSPQVEEKTKEFNLLPNTFASLEIDGTPLFTQDVFISNAHDEDTNLLKDKKHPMKPDDMVQKAHPKSIYVSNALGDGGLVENQNEQHDKMVQVINKMPTGNLINLYAEIIETLTKVASEVETTHPKIANEIDTLLEDLTK